MMRHLSNIADPEDKFAQLLVVPRHGETQEEAWEEQVRWLEGKIIGEPKATGTYSVNDLESMGYVGVYAND